MSDDLGAFLLARIAEDERVAEATACQCGGPTCGDPRTHWYGSSELQARLENGNAESHVMRWSPARVLADCASRRAIVELHSGAHHCDCGPDDTGWVHEFETCQTLRLLAVPYSDVDGYQDEWRPR